MAQHNILGKKGEEMAVEYLVSKGYEILERNWRNGRDEVDIICYDGEMLVIVEVKTRSTGYYGDPEEAVTRKKRKFLVRAAEEYVMQKEIDNEIRFDIVSIISSDKGDVIDHIKDAFYPALGD